MRRFPCRCRRCEARRTFRKHPDEYVRERRCSCGGTYRVDWYRKTKENKRVLCWCDTWWFPHRHDKKECR